MQRNATRARQRRTRDKREALARRAAVRAADTRSFRAYARKLVSWVTAR